MISNTALLKTSITCYDSKKGKTSLCYFLNLQLLSIVTAKRSLHSQCMFSGLRLSVGKSCVYIIIMGQVKSILGCDSTR